MNITPLNLTPIDLNAALCVEKGVVNYQCVITEICHQTSQHYRGWAIGLLVAFLVIDLALPLIMRYLGAWLAARNPLMFGWMVNPELRQYWQNWLKARLLWGFVILTLYQIFY